MSPLIKATFASCLVLGLLMPACAQPARHMHVQPLHPYRRTPVVRRTPPPFRRAPVGVAGRSGNAVTTRKVFLWARPAKIEPHLREVPGGRPVQVVGSQNGFYAAIMHDGLHGWLPADAVRPR